MNDQRILHVALVDDHELIGEAVAHALAADALLAFCGTAASVDEALALQPTPDVVVLDLQLADDSSPAGNIDRLAAAGIAVVVYTSGENVFLLRAAISAGAPVIVRKSEPVDVLLDAVRALAAGHPTASVDWAAGVESDPAIGAARLSAQEERILGLFASGHKMQSVAFHAGVSTGTVEDYLRRIRIKYARVGRHAVTQIDLYKRAVEDGIVRRPSRADVQ